MAETMRCPACTGDLPKGSRFCPHCGTALAEEGTAEMFTRHPSTETRELLAEQSTRPGMSLHEAQRRPLGAPPAAFLAAITVCALVAVLILLIIGVWIGAIIALGVFLVGFTLLVSATRHDPNSPAARQARRAASHTTSTARFFAVAAGAWARAGVSLLHIKQRRVRIRRDLRRQLSPLGEAVHEGDETRADQIKAHARELERQLEESEHQASAVIAEAREVVGREKANAEPTQTLPVDEIDPSVAPDTPPVPPRVRPTRRQAPGEGRSPSDGRAPLRQ